jgi:hypothetical protein
MAELIRDQRYREFFRIADFTFGMKKGPCAIIQLQAGVFIGYEGYKAIENYLTGSQRPRRKSFDDLLRPEHDFVMAWSDTAIGAWVNRLNEYRGNVIESMIVRE